VQVFYVLAVLSLSLCSPAALANTPILKGRAVVASYNPHAREAAKQVLLAEGNAFDAFIAATLVGRI
jgi:gamma-glutamyltranspeptidase